MNSTTLPMRLQLRLLRSHGVETSVVLPMPVGREVDLTAAWAASPVPVPDEQRAAMAHCRIGHAGPEAGDGMGWSVTNHSAELVCVINQQRVRRGDTRRLIEGDALELGLMRFVVERCEPALAPEPVPAVYNEFELTNLLLIERTGNPVDAFGRSGANADPVTGAGDSRADASRSSRQLIDAHDSPFSDIADMAYRLDVVAPDAARAEEGSDTAADAVTDAAADEVLDVKGPDLMRRLHAQYLRLMRNPHEVEPVGEWNPELARVPSRNNALEDLTQRAIGFDSLYDILGHGGTIGTVLEGLDTLTHCDLLGAEPGVNVLRLFAPADLLVQASGLPNLTRREHHLLSADSAAHLEQLPPSSLP